MICISFCTNIYYIHLITFKRLKTKLNYRKQIKRNLTKSWISTHGLYCVEEKTQIGSK